MQDLPRARVPLAVRLPASCATSSTQLRDTQHKLHQRSAKGREERLQAEKGEGQAGASCLLPWCRGSTGVDHGVQADKAASNSVKPVSAPAALPAKETPAVPAVNGEATGESFPPFLAEAMNRQRAQTRPKRSGRRKSERRRGSESERQRQRPPLLPRLRLRRRPTSPLLLYVRLLSFPQQASRALSWHSRTYESEKGQEAQARAPHCRRRLGSSDHRATRRARCSACNERSRRPSTIAGLHRRRVCGTRRTGQDQRSLYDGRSTNGR